jgi:hypothetical protein
MQNQTGSTVRRGRPPAEEPTTPVSVRFPQSLLDRIHRAAEARGESVSMWFRRITLVALAAEEAASFDDEDGPGEAGIP